MVIKITKIVIPTFGLSSLAASSSSKIIYIDNKKYTIKLKVLDDKINYQHIGLDCILISL